MKNSGHIRQRINDADFLVAHGRYEAALLLLLIAIDGSAIKVFPKDTPSISKPGKKKEMRNWERYQRFLGVRLRQEMGFDLDEKAYHIKNLSELPQFINDQDPPEKIIYETFRNNDVHESRIPEHHHYVYSEQGISNSMGMEFSNGDVRFSTGFLTLLRRVVVNAPCNGVEFGIKHIRLSPKEDMTTSDFINKLSDDYSLSPGRIEAMIKIIEATEVDINAISDVELAKALSYTLKTRYPSAVTGLSFTSVQSPICRWDEGFTEYGASVCRDILKKSRVVNIST